MKIDVTITLSTEDIQTLAVRLHNMFCKLSHADMCMWHYEIVDGEHDWDGWEHSRWFDHANQIQQMILQNLEG